MKWKAFFINFKGLSLKQIKQTFLESERSTYLSYKKLYVFQFQKHLLDGFCKKGLFRWILQIF